MSDAQDDDDGNNVRVCVRIRPLSDTEVQRGDTSTCTALTDGRSLRMMHFSERSRKWETQTLRFDRVFSPDATQLDVFHQSGVEGFCDAAADGIAATVFCFGQTGSGKTFTMTGPIKEDDYTTEDHISSATQGIQFRAMHYFARMIEESRTPEGQPTLAVKAAMYEIYNEQVNDLLNETTNLKVRWSQTQQAFFVESLMLVQCDNLEDMLAVLQQGLSNRKRAAHLLNQDSSRSHVILSLGFERQTTDGSPPRLGKLNLVDLAGSEKLKDSGSAGANATETKNINQSLLALGKVISALASRSNEAFVPYRDSTLTRLLMDSLGGNAKTLMMACVTPSSKYAEESIKTIRYAVRASSIVNMSPTVRVDPRRLEVFELKSELDVLRKENAMLKERLAVFTQNGIPARLPSMAPTPTYDSSQFTPPTSSHDVRVTAPAAREVPKYKPPFSHQAQQPVVPPVGHYGGPATDVVGYSGMFAHQLQMQHQAGPQSAYPPSAAVGVAPNLAGPVPFQQQAYQPQPAYQQQQQAYQQQQQAYQQQQPAYQQQQQAYQQQQQAYQQQQQAYQQRPPPLVPSQLVPLPTRISGVAPSSETDDLRNEVAQLRNMILESRAHAVATGSPTRKHGGFGQPVAASPSPRGTALIHAGEPRVVTQSAEPPAQPNGSAIEGFGFRAAPKKSQRLGFLQAQHQPPDLEGTSLTAPVTRDVSNPSATIHSTASAPVAFAPRHEIENEVSRMNEQLAAAQRELLSFRGGQSSSSPPKAYATNRPAAAASPTGTAKAPRKR